MRLEVRKYLFDIQQAANDLLSFTAGKTRDNYLAEAREALWAYSSIRSRTCCSARMGNPLAKCAYYMRICHRIQRHTLRP